MKNLKKILFVTITLLMIQSCGVYNLTGGSVGTAKTFRIPLFQNYASQSAGSTIERFYTSTPKFIFKPN